MKIVSVIGARPQFIKCAALSRELRKANDEIIIHTGQHYDLEMSGIFFNELHIPEPDHNLGIGSGHHGEQTGRMLIGIEKILLNEEPEMRGYELHHRRGTFGIKAGDPMLKNSE